MLPYQAFGPPASIVIYCISTNLSTVMATQLVLQYNGLFIVSLVQTSAVLYASGVVC